jgi:hypothetical protein
MNERDDLERLAVVLVGWHLCLAMILVLAVMWHVIGLPIAGVVAISSAGLSALVLHRTWRRR